MKKKIVAVLTAVFCISAIVARADIGADYYYLGEYGKAESYLQQHMSADPAKANFYLGEIAFAQGNTAKAAEYYNKALAANPSFMEAQVGLAKLKLKSNPEEAEAAFKELGKAYRKSAPLAVAIGRAYLDNGMLDQASKKVEEAMGFDKKLPAIYLLEGDILAARKASSGDLTGKYEQASYFGPDELLPYMKLALVYEKRNPASAIAALEKALALDPKYTIAYGLLGRIYISAGRYPEAIEALKTYFAESNYSANDIERMARAYYFGEPEKLNLTDQQKYDEAKKWVAQGLQKDPDHFVLNRYKMYLDAKTGDATAGLADAQKFFALRTADTTYIPLDYTMYGTILKEAGRPADAIAQFDKAIKLDPALLSTYDEAVAMARELGNYNLAAQYYEKMVEAKKKTDETKYQSDLLLDINSLGNLYFQAGTLTAKNTELVNSLMADANWQKKLLAEDPSLNADSLRTSASYFAKGFAKYNLVRADSFFRQVIEQAPESYMGYYYLARTSNALYPGAEGIANGIPKENYAKTVSTIEARKDDGQPSATMLRAFKEGLGYLSYYYYMTDDKENAILYSNKLLAVDPENANAKAILEDLNNRK